MEKVIASYPRGACCSTVLSVLLLGNTVPLHYWLQSTSSLYNSTCAAAARVSGYPRVALAACPTCRWSPVAVENCLRLTGVRPTCYACTWLPLSLWHLPRPEAPENKLRQENKPGWLHGPMRFFSQREKKKKDIRRDLLARCYPQKQRWDKC